MRSTRRTPTEPSVLLKIQRNRPGLFQTRVTTIWGSEIQISQNFDDEDGVSLCDSVQDITYITDSDGNMQRSAHACLTCRM